MQVFTTNLTDASGGYMARAAVHIEVTPEYRHHITDSMRFIIDMAWMLRQKGKIHYKSVNRLIIAIYHQYFPLVTNQSRRRQWIVDSMMLHKRRVKFVSLLARSSNRISLPIDLVHKIVRDETIIKPADLKAVIQYQMKEILYNGTFNVCIHLLNITCSLKT